MQVVSAAARYTSRQKRRIRLSLYLFLNVPRSILLAPNRNSTLNVVHVLASYRTKLPT
jgi:hypothetical protein